MPLVVNQPFTRRRFLSVSAAGIGAVLLQSRRVSHATEASPSTTRWALLSDTHVPQDPSNRYRGFFPFENCKAVVSRLIQDPPDGVIVTGDLARLEGFPGDYAVLKSLLLPLFDRQIPVGMTLGNHDDRDHFLNAFQQHPGSRPSVQGKFVVIIEQPPVRFVLLDSLMFVNKTPGWIGKAQREWLRLYLREASSMPTLIFFHHSLRDVDGDLLDWERVFPILYTNQQVKAVLYGHSHEYKHEERFGMHLINLPAVGYNFNDRDPVGWIDARLSATGGEFTLRAIGGNEENNGKTLSLTWRG